MLGIGMQLQRAYRQGYALDARNSAITAVRGKPDLVVIEVQNHYATAHASRCRSRARRRRAGAERAAQRCPTRAACSSACTTRWRALPEQPMAARKRRPARRLLHAPRVQDFSDDLARTPRVRYVNRWRLEKKDPAAALSRAGQADHLLARPHDSR